MNTAPVSQLIAGYSFLEGPRWRDGRLWLSDFYTGQVFTVGLDGRTERIAEVPQQPSGLGWLPDGRLLVVSMRDRAVLRREPDGTLVRHADLSAIAGGHANDMVVDSRGRAWVGNFGFDLMGGGAPAPAQLALVDPDGTVSVAASELYFPNGSMLTPDERMLIVCETMGNRISAFDVHEDGTLGPRRDWAVFGDLPPLTDVPGTLSQLKAAPDGAVLDADGAVWFADAIGQRAVRMAPGGAVLEQISTAPLGCFALTLGGPERRTLFMCVAPDFHEHARQAAREAQIMAVTVRVPGAGTP